MDFQRLPGSVMRIFRDIEALILSYIHISNSLKTKQNRYFYQEFLKSIYGSESNTAFIENIFARLQPILLSKQYTSMTVLVICFQKILFLKQC